MSRTAIRYLALVAAGALVGSALAEELKCEGSIAKIEGENLSVKVANGEQQVRIEPATKIIIRGKPGSAMDLKVGQQVRCLCDKKDDKVVCTTLEVMGEKDG